MATKKASNKDNLFKPQYPLTFVSEEETCSLPVESITIKKVGEKAYGLSCLPKPWTLSFIVVSEELFSLYQECLESDRKDLLNDWVDRIKKAVLSVGIEETDPIIVRSSGCAEGLTDRGEYYSFNGVFSNIYILIAKSLQELNSDSGLSKHKIPLIIQKYVTPFSARGHLSNERRLYKEARDWLGDYEDGGTTIKESFRINLRNWREKISFEQEVDTSLGCNLSAHVSEKLKIPVAWVYDKGLRLHFEWVWDGETIYLVQADLELKLGGENPTKFLASEKKLKTNIELKCLREVEESKDARFNKLHNFFVYKSLELPSTKLYVLDDQAIINNLTAGTVLPELKNDLSQLVEGSLIIRMDVATDEKEKRQLLPRTEEIRNLEAAVNWLTEMSAKIKKNIEEDIVFIFHNFIPAESSVFAYAAPGQRKVQIEALWGLPEGLYYNNHDKYTVDTGSARLEKVGKEKIKCFEVIVKPNNKRFFVAPDDSGNWLTKRLKQPYDWKESISKEDWVKEIAYESRKIAEKEGKPLSIMWFVGVPSKICPRQIFPWYHESIEFKVNARTKSNRTKTPFDRTVEINTSSDIEKLKEEVKSKKGKIRRISIQPREDKLLRDKGTLRLIGELAQKIDAIILLEGGVLSHAYYQLMQTNAVVEIVHPFEDSEGKREFNKLVRDKIPSNIEEGGEVVSAASLTGDSLLRALKEKLIEESTEVLDAIDQDSIIGELADVKEVVDAILLQLNSSRETLQERQDKKRNKAGGFSKGIVLKETRNPSLSTGQDETQLSLFPDLAENDRVIANEHSKKDIEHPVDKWSDRKMHTGATETILRLKVPLTKDTWAADTLKMAIESDVDNEFQVKITGKRVGSKQQIELTVFTPRKQLKLFSA